jgi:hypothetical protein
MKGFFGNLLGIFSKHWWVEVSTTNPRCIYYFGPFDKEADALAAQSGYLQDLEQEGARDIQVTVMHCQEPEELTIELPDNATGSVSPAYQL